MKLPFTNMRTGYYLFIVCFFLLILLARPTAAQAEKSCEGADYLLSVKDLPGAKAMYLALADESETAACAIEGLKKVAAAEELAKRDTKPTPQLLADKLTIVGIQPCLAWMTNWLPDSWCGTQWTGYSHLFIPLANAESEVPNLSPINPIPFLVTNTETGKTLSLKTSIYTTTGELAAISVVGNGFNIANGVYSGSLDLLPADKEKGSIDIEIKLRDSIVWPIVFVLLGVFISTGVRIRYNKELPANALEAELKALQEKIGKEGVSQPYENPKDDWDRALRRYSILAGSQSRLQQLAAKLPGLIRNYKIAHLGPKSEDELVKIIYTGKQTEEVLLKALVDFVNQTQIPTHVAFKVAFSEWYEMNDDSYKPLLLDEAKEHLYKFSTKNQKLDPEPLADPTTLTELQTMIAYFLVRLVKLAPLMHDVRLALDLINKLHKFENQMDPNTKKEFATVRGKLAIVHSKLKTKLDVDALVFLQTQVADVVYRLGGLYAAFDPGYESATALAPTRIAPAPGTAEYQTITPTKVRGVLGTGILALQFYRPWPNLISLVLALAFALSTLYFGKTFGTSADYIAALAWGLGIDTATKVIPTIISGLGIK